MSRPGLALFIKNFSPYGGVERFAFDFSGHLRDRGWDIRVVCARNDTDLGPPLVTATGYLRPGRLLKTLSFQHRSLSILEQMSDRASLSCGSIPHCTVYRTSGVHARFMASSIQGYAGWLPKARKILSRALNPYNAVIRHLEKTAYTSPRTRSIVAISGLVAGEIKSTYPQAGSRIVVIPNGVDKSVYSIPARDRLRAEARESLGVSGESVAVGFCGTNFELKGLPVLLRALAGLPPRTILLVAGGRGTRRYRQMAERLGVGGRVRFLGRQQRMDRFYAGCDVLCHPSFYDTFGSVVAEALAMGLPVVTSPFVGAKDLVVDGVNGRVVSALEPVKLRQSIQEALELGFGDHGQGVLDHATVFERYLEVLCPTAKEGQS